MNQEQTEAMLTRLEEDFIADGVCAPEAPPPWPAMYFSVPRGDMKRLLALARRASSAEKALREIADAGREDGEGIEEATGGRNFDDAYWEGCNHGAFVAGEIARAVLEEKR